MVDILENDIELDRANRTIRQSFLRGVALTIPLIVTLFIFGFALRSIRRVVEPFADGAMYLLGTQQLPDFVLELFALVLLFWFVLAVGVVADRQSGRSRRVTKTLEQVIADVPGFGSVYQGVRQLSEVMLHEDSDSFQEVKLLEFPGEGSFMLCYLTATPPESVQQVVGEKSEKTMTLFVPLAPNPVMGGFLVHAAEDRVYDIELDVEESMRAIITSGVAVDPTLADNADTDTPTNTPDRIH